jgi:hypothetical protein
LLLLQWLNYDIVSVILRKLRVETPANRFILNQLPPEYKREVEASWLDYEDSKEGRLYRCIRHVQDSFKINHRKFIQECSVELDGFIYIIDYVKQTGVFNVSRLKGGQWICRLAMGKMSNGNLLWLNIRSPSERLCVIYMAVAFAWVCNARGNINLDTIKTIADKL